MADCAKGLAFLPLFDSGMKVGSSFRRFPPLGLISKTNSSPSDLLKRFQATTRMNSRFQASCNETWENYLRNIIFYCLGIVP